MNGWMVRAGEGGRLFDDFEKGYVAIGWSRIGDMSGLNTREKINRAYEEHFADQKPGKRHNAAAMAHKFRNEFSEGDLTVTYNPTTREYLVGEITGNYQFSPDLVGDYPNVRKVKWLGKVSRDTLTTKTRNSLGSVLTLFALNPEVINDLRNVLGHDVQPRSSQEAVDEEQSELKEEIVSKSKEHIKDHLVSLDDEEMEQMVAAVFRAMGFQARVSSKGADRNVDVFASPDGLGLQEPRIKAEVKHRVGSIGSSDIRSFIGALRPGDKGVFVSTGGFSREARYEAERANVPVTLVDIDLLADLIIGNYEQFDLEGKALIPLVRIYWLAE